MEEIAMDYKKAFLDTRTKNQIIVWLFEVIESFNVLLNSLPPEADYVFFCDQDDIWEADKIEKEYSVFLDLIIVPLKIFLHYK